MESAMRSRILLVEDEPSLILSLCDRLAAEGFEVEVAEDVATGFDKARHGSFDLLVLDVMLPDGSGFDLCRDLRQLRIETPVLILSARGEAVDKVVGLKLGADDYLGKPFDMMELLARIEALLRRARRAAESPTYVFGPVRVDFRRAEVLRDGQPVELSALEYRLLRYLVEHRGELLTRDDLLEKVWGYDRAVFSRTVDQHVASLRRKIEPDPARPQFLLTLYGLGYRFVG
jgi:two-component system, OmpR family, alkaline phosphatase synthesis response regulator PhoP